MVGNYRPGLHNQTEPRVVFTWPEDTFRFDIRISNGHPIALIENAPLRMEKMALSDTGYELNDGKIQKRFGK
jgi:hypothetical protein